MRCFALLSIMSFLFQPHHMMAQGVEGVQRDLIQLEGEVATLSRHTLDVHMRRSPTYVEERLTDGELFFRLKDYVRSSIIFTDIVEQFPNHRAYPDAQYLLAESLFMAEDHLGARTNFRKILDRASEQSFKQYIQHTLGRLIEIAVHTNDYDGVEGYFEKLSQLPPSEVEAATSYFRAKYLYNLSVDTNDTEAPLDAARLEEARAAFMQVPPRTPHYLQSMYFVGVVDTAKGDFPKAIDGFRKVIQGAAETVEQREVFVLAQLALGRLYYETQQMDQAVEAYQMVSRTSKHFDRALYEVAWVFIGMGDAIRAERALEVLSIATPSSKLIPDSKVLRGNLLLRTGRFDDASKVFAEVRKEFGPIRQELDAMMQSREQEGLEYFKRLVRENLEAFDAASFLPASAQRWVELDDDMSRALTVLGDLSNAKRMLQETSQLAERLSSALGLGANGALSPSRAIIFADLRREMERTTMMRNKLVRLKKRLVDAEVEGAGSSALQRVRAERRALESEVLGMPTNDDEFRTFDTELLSTYRNLERELGRLEVELMGLEARITATRVFMESTRDARNDEARQAILDELTRQVQAIEDYKKSIAELKVSAEAERLRIGVGDDRHRTAAELRGRYERLLEDEMRLGGGRNRMMFDRMGALGQSLSNREAKIIEVVDMRTAEIKSKLDEENAKIAGYQNLIASLEGETEEVVGGVTHSSFKKIQERFYDLVLRADVGEIDITWAEREEHRIRVEMLTRERTREMRVLDDEFAEIMDETGGTSLSENGTGSENGESTDSPSRDPSGASDSEGVAE